MNHEYSDMHVRRLLNHEHTQAYGGRIISKNAQSTHRLTWTSSFRPDRWRNHVQRHALAIQSLSTKWSKLWAASSKDIYRQLASCKCIQAKCDNERRHDNGIEYDKQTRHDNKRRYDRGKRYDNARRYKIKQKYDNERRYHNERIFDNVRRYNMSLRCEHRLMIALQMSPKSPWAHTRTFRSIPIDKTDIVVMCDRFETHKAFMCAKPLCEWNWPRDEHVPFKAPNWCQGWPRAQNAHKLLHTARKVNKAWPHSSTELAKTVR